MSEWTEPPAKAGGDCGCDEAVNELWAYLDAELEQHDAERVRAHLAGCHGCLEEHDVELVVKKLVQRCYATADLAPDELRAKVRASLTVTVRTTIVESASEN